jgi:hypothetical protein
MSPDRQRCEPAAATAAAGKSKYHSRRVTTALALIGALLAALVAPAAAAAHGPVDPAATSYLARVRQAPSGLDAKVVDGDLRMWLHADPAETVVVLDYRGAPYLRFAAHGVEVNRNSSMYYLNQVPAELVPSNIGPRTPPSWERVSGGHDYEWHDGRLAALAAVALAPGTRYAGRWSIPVRVDGRAAVIAGGLTYAPNPSIVWFWPIVVVVSCVLAGLRLGRPALDVRIARALALASLVGFALAGAGEELHGRPSVSIGQLVLLAFVVTFVVWASRRLLLRRHGWFGFFLIALAALFEGGSLIGVLVHGFVLVALPPFVARTAVVVCLAAGGALLPVIFRLAERPERFRSPARSDQPQLDWEDEAAWEWDG